MTTLRSRKTAFFQAFLRVSSGALLAGALCAQTTVTTRVDARVELLTTVARLAGFPEFNMANSSSPYARRVEAHFAPWKEHEVVGRLRELRSTRGISHDAVTSLAVHFDGIEKLGELTPFDPLPERVDPRWTPALAREFAALLRDFATASKASDFFAREREFFAQVAARLGERLSQSKALPWFDAFFGAKASASYVGIAGLLCGGNNTGVGVRFADGAPELITPVFGCWEWDESGTPVFGEEYLPLLIHELCHSYTNPLVDRFVAALEPAGARLFARVEAGMRRQNYSTWKIVIAESVVRACVVRCRLATEGVAQAREQAREEIARLFAWVPDLAASFGAYESDRARYATFDAYMPQVVAFFDGYVAQLEREDALRPRVVSIEPANGASDVDASVAELVIRFDRPMRDQSWSIHGPPADMPEITGKPVYDEKREVLRTPIRLAPGRTYRFSLNSAQSTGFKSAEGIALAPVEVQFTTRK